MVATCCSLHHIRWSLAARNSAAAIDMRQSNSVLAFNGSSTQGKRSTRSSGKLPPRASLIESWKSSQLSIHGSMLCLFLDFSTIQQDGDFLFAFSTVVTNPQPSNTQAP